MNREQRVTWIALAFMACLMAAWFAFTYLIEPRFGNATVPMRILTLAMVTIAILAMTLGQRPPTGAVEEDERTKMIRYQASWFGFMGGFVVALLYGFLTILWHERSGMAAISFQTLETILTRQASAAGFSLLVIRYGAILVLYRNKSAE
jgi:hypothetical protein